MRKHSRRPIAAFEEKILYVPLKLSNHPRDKVEDNMKDGVWLGIKWRTDKAIIGTPHGVVWARDVRRLPNKQKWDAEFIMKVTGPPRRPTPHNNDTEMPTDPGLIGGEHVDEPEVFEL